MSEWFVVAGRHSAYSVDLDAEFALDLSLLFLLDEYLMCLGVREHRVVPASQFGFECPVGYRWRTVRVSTIACVEEQEVVGQESTSSAWRGRVERNRTFLTECPRLVHGQPIVAKITQAVHYHLGVVPEVADDLLVEPSAVLVL